MVLLADFLANMDMSALFRLPIKAGILYAANTNKEFLRQPATGKGPPPPLPPAEDPYPIHQLQWFGFENYTDTQMNFMRAWRVLWFHAGLFLFKNTPAMKEHFTNIRAAIMRSVVPGTMARSPMCWYPCSALIIFYIYIIFSLFK